MPSSRFFALALASLRRCAEVDPRKVRSPMSDFAKMVGAQTFANYGRLYGTDGYFIDEDMNTLMNPQVVLAWLLNDEPIPPQHGAPLRLIVPFRYDLRSARHGVRRPVGSINKAAPQLHVASAVEPQVEHRSSIVAPPTAIRCGFPRWFSRLAPSASASIR